MKNKIMKGRVICFTDSLGSGGAQRQLVGLACMLKEQRYDVSVLLYYDNSFYKPILDEKGIESIVLVGTSNYVIRVWSIYKYLRGQKGAIIIAYQETPSLIACLLRPFIKCSNLIVSERNTTQVISIKDKIRFALYRFANYIVPNSYTQADFIRKFYPNLSNKIECITNFVDTTKFIPSSLRVENKTKRILTVARVMRQKNLLNYIKAIKIVSDKGYKIKVDWYGSPLDESYFNECNYLIKELCLEEIFQFHSATRNIIEEYQTSDIFCLPSNYEGFPNVVCEAMCCGLPILCSNVCDNGYIVEQGINGFLFDPNRIDDIVARMIEMLKLSIDEFYKISYLNRERALSLFSSEKFIEKYNKII